MAGPFGYQQQVAPRAMPLPGGRGVGFGSQTAAAVGQLGEALGDAAERERKVREYEADAAARVAEIEDQRNLARGASEAAVRYAEMQARVGAREAELRAAMPEGGEGYEDALFSAYDEEQGGFVETLADERLQQRFLPLLAENRGNLAVRAKVAVLDASADKAKVDAEKMADLFGNTLRTNPDPAQRDNFLSAIDAFVDAQSLPQTAKKAVRAALRQKVIIGQWSGVNDRDPQAALDWIATGDLDADMTPEQLQAMRGQAESGINRLRVEAERAQRLADAAAKAELDEFKEDARVAIEDVGNGVEVNPAELADKARMAREAGDERLAQDLDEASARAAVTVKYTGASTAELNAARREIEQSNNWRSDRKLVASHSQLGTLIDRQTRRASEDKLGLYIEHGGAKNLPAFNLSDPSAVRRYFAVGDAAAKKYGGSPQYMPEDVAAPLREAFKKGGALEQFKLIQNMAAYGSVRGKHLMRQIAPSEPRYAVLVDLAAMRNRAVGRERVQETLNGWEQIKANPKLIDGGKMQADVDALYGTALSALDGQTKLGLRSVAEGLYANEIARSGGSAYNRDLWLKSYREAIGEAGDGTGGVGKAANGKPMLLPRGVSEKDFHHVLSRADGEMIQNAAYGGRDAPLWGEQRMTPTQFKKLMPVMVSDGIYAFRSGSGFAMSQSNPSRYFMLDIRALGGAQAGGK